MYTTNAIESLNSTYKRINRNRKVFPTDMALLKVMCLSTLKAEKNGQEWLISGIYAYLNLRLCMKVEYKRGGDLAYERK